MSAERDVNRIVRSWIREDEYDSADAILGIVLSRLDSTPQRRSSWPARRFSQMQRTTQGLVAAAAILVVAVAGYSILTRPGETTGNDQSPVPTAIPTALESPVPTISSPTAQQWPMVESTLEAGTYSTRSGFVVNLTATVPAGWSALNGGPNVAELWREGAPGGLAFQTPAEVAVDPCDRSKGLEVVGPSVDALVTALGAMPSIAVSEVADTAVDGYAGKQMTITAPDANDECSSAPEAIRLWVLPLGLAWTIPAGASIHVSIVDVAGVRVVITVDDAELSGQEQDELRQVVDSIGLEPLT